MLTEMTRSQFFQALEKFYDPDIISRIWDYYQHQETHLGEQLRFDLDWVIQQWSIYENIQSVADSFTGGLHTDIVLLPLEDGRWLLTFL